MMVHTVKIISGPFFSSTILQTTLPYGAQQFYLPVTSLQSLASGATSAKSLTAVTADPVASAWQAIGISATSNGEDTMSNSAQDSHVVIILSTIGATIVCISVAILIVFMIKRAPFNKNKNNGNPETKANPRRLSLVASPSSSAAPYQLALSPSGSMSDSDSPSPSPDPADQLLPSSSGFASAASPGHRLVAQADTATEGELTIELSPLASLSAPKLPVSFNEDTSTTQQISISIQ